MQKYKAAKGSQFNDTQAQTIGERLEKLSIVTPETVLSDARKKSSPLHEFFQWDDAAAAEAFRVFQARNLVNHLLVVIKTPDGVVETKAFHNIRVTVSQEDAVESDQRVYISAAAAKDDPQARKQIIAAAMAELARWQSRYDQYRDVFGAVFREIEKVERRVERGSQNALAFA